jgi:Flp pilus assembly protein TadG
MFLTLILGMVDLGLAVYRQQVLSRAARQGARLASLHGSAALTTWGTGSIDVFANTSGTPIVDTLNSNGALNGLILSQTEVKVSWLDANNDPESERNRVQVTITSPYTPMITWIFGSPTWTLSAASTMHISH